MNTNVCEEKKGYWCGKGKGTHGERERERGAELKGTQPAIHGS